MNTVIAAGLDTTGEWITWVIQNEEGLNDQYFYNLSAIQCVYIHPHEDLVDPEPKPQGVPRMPRPENLKHVKFWDVVLDVAHVAGNPRVTFTTEKEAADFAEVCRGGERFQ